MQTAIAALLGLLKVRSLPSRLINSGLQTAIAKLLGLVKVRSLPSRLINSDCKQRSQNFSVYRKCDRFPAD
ncbi:hypothetical protein H6G64_34745 [Calothrix sp. FACHB-156]|nr:hypothetical protein [Calothrix sp. FACHB-156]